MGTESDSTNNEINTKQSIVGAVIQGTTIKTGNINLNGIQCESSAEKFDIPCLIDSFKGREDNILELDNLFFKQKQKKVVICGLPGYGKTELVKQYAKKCYVTKKVQKIFWIESENPDYLQKLSSKLKQMYNNKKLKDKVCLFIFDNAVDRRSIFNYEPPISHKYLLLITSQVEDWGNDVKSIKLKPLSPYYALEVLRSVLGDYFNETNYENYRKLISLVGYVPLGLQIVACYLRKELGTPGNFFNFEDYIIELEHTEKDILESTISSCMPNQYDKSIYSALKVSLDKIKDEFKNRRHLLIILYVCSYLNPDMIWFNDLLTIINMIQTVKANELAKILHDFNNFSFISYTSSDSPIRIHRLTQLFLSYHLSTYEFQIHNHCYELCLKCVFDDESKIHSKRHHFQTILIHADKNIDIVYNFYKKHLPNENSVQTLKKYMLKKIDKLHMNRKVIVKNIFTRLVQHGCVKCLENIFENNKKNVKKVICKYNLLYHAVVCNQVDILNLLLQNISDINIIDSEKNTALHLAARFWNIESIKLLIANGANVNLRNFEGNIPLFIFVKDVLHNRKEVNWIEILDIFKFSPESLNNNKENLLHLAVIGCHDELIELLINKYHMDINQQNSSKRTPLHCLTFYLEDVKRGMIINTIKTLLNFGALFSIEDINNETASDRLLDYAINKNHLDLLKFILEHSDINKIYENKNTLLHKAASTKNLEIIKYLVENKADVNAKNANGDIPSSCFMNSIQQCDTFSLNMSDVNDILDLLKCN